MFLMPNNLSKIILFYCIFSFYACERNKLNSEKSKIEKIIYKEFALLPRLTDVEISRSDDTCSIRYEKLSDSVYSHKTFDRSSRLVILELIDFTTKPFIYVIGNDTSISQIIDQKKVILKNKNNLETTIYKVLTLCRNGHNDLLSFWTIEDGKILTKFIGGEGYCQQSPKYIWYQHYVDNQSKNDRLQDLRMSIFTSSIYSSDFSSISKEIYNPILRKKYGIVK